NIFFDRKSKRSGYAILGAKNIHDPDGPWNAAGNWMIRDVVSRAGPIALVGPRNILINVDVANWSDRMFPVIGKTHNETGEVIYDRYAGCFRGCTFGQYGGAFSAKKAARTAAYYGTGGYSLTGGITWSNAREHTDEFYTSNVCFMGATRGFISGVSTEGDCDYDVQFGLEDSGKGPGDAIGTTVIAGVSAFNTINIQTSVGETWLYGFRDITIRKEDYANLIILSSGSVKFEEGHDPWLPGEIIHLNLQKKGSTFRVGGMKGDPQTQFGMPVHDHEPKHPQEATLAVADGENWDPVGNGNAVLVAYDTDGKWKPVFEYSDSL
ncbi:MAG: hypothetical protein ACOC0A_05420, partial [Planctomycetota bacterium]